jgi:hypothetical protein
MEEKKGTTSAKISKMYFRAHRISNGRPWEKPQAWGRWLKRGIRFLLFPYPVTTILFFIANVSFRRPLYVWSREWMGSWCWLWNAPSGMVNNDEPQITVCLKNERSIIYMYAFSEGSWVTMEKYLYHTKVLRDLNGDGADTRFLFIFLPSDHIILHIWSDLAAPDIRWAFSWSGV